MGTPPARPVRRWLRRVLYPPYACAQGRIAGRLGSGAQSGALQLRGGAGRDKRCVSASLPALDGAVLLQDLVTNKKAPPELKCRQVRLRARQSACDTAAGRGGRLGSCLRRRRAPVGALHPPLPPALLPTATDDAHQRLALHQPLGRPRPRDAPAGLWESKIRAGERSTNANTLTSGRRPLRPGPPPPPSL